MALSWASAILLRALVLAPSCDSFLLVVYTRYRRNENFLISVEHKRGCSFAKAGSKNSSRRN
jgi:hypothetical protein